MTQIAPRKKFIFYELIQLATLSGTGCFLGWWFDQMLLGFTFGLGGYCFTLWRRWWCMFNETERSPNNHNLREKAAFRETGGELSQTKLSVLSKQQHILEKKSLRFLYSLNALTAEIEDALVILAPDHRIVWSNVAAKRLLDISYHTDQGEILENLWRDSFLHDFLDNHTNQESYLCHAPVAFQQDPISLEVRCFPTTIQELNDQEHLLLIARDVSEAQRFQKEQEFFVANVSHELRTPLTVFYGCFSVLENKLSQLDQASDLKSMLLPIKKQLERMRRTIDSLLNLHRVSAYAVTQEEVKQQVNLCQLAENVFEEFKPVARSKDIELDYVCQGSAQIEGFPDALRSAFSNIIMNAINYTVVGSIVVRTEQQNKKVIFSVQDTGVGIDKQEIPKITDRFYRVVNLEVRSNSRGSGLGLAVVKSVLALHEATLEIESEKGVGTIVRCIFSYMEG